MAVAGRGYVSVMIVEVLVPCRNDLMNATRNVNSQCIDFQISISLEPEDPYRVQVVNLMMVVVVLGVMIVLVIVRAQFE